MCGTRWGIMRRAALALTLFLGIHLPASAGNCLTFGVPSGAGATDEIMSVIREAGKRAGLRVETLRAPRNRLSALPLDGEILTEEALPYEPAGLIALPTPVATFEGALYWLPGHEAPTGPKARIGVILGQEWAFRAVAARGSQPYEVRDNRQLMNMMAAGRLDGMMLPAISFRHFLPGYPALKACRTQDISPLPVLVLLKSSRSEAAGALDRALAAVKRDGTADRIFKRYAP